MVITVVSLCFFQAEDGIRDADVTGVQTCALPISAIANAERPRAAATRDWRRRRSGAGADGSRATRAARRQPYERQDRADELRFLQARSRQLRALARAGARSD